MKQQTSVSTHPSLLSSTSLCPTRVSKDVPMRMPRRRASSNSLTSPDKSHHQLLSSSFKRSTCPVLYSPKSSMHWLDNCETDTPLGNDRVHLTCGELSSLSAALLVAVETVDDETERGVRFVPSSQNAIVTSIGLREYTSEEIEACWYSRDDIKSMRYSTTNKKSHPKRDSCYLLLNRNDKRWSAEPSH